MKKKRETKAKPKAAPAAKKEEEGSDEILWDTVINEIKEIAGVGKKYKRWQLSLANGETISTFDKSIGESLKEGEPVRLIVKQDGKFYKLVGVEAQYETLETDTQIVPERSFRVSLRIERDDP
jgi:hypothetical protein